MNEATLEMTKHLIMCPRCESEYFVPYEAPPEVIRWASGKRILPPALSRFDNSSNICSSCGTHEAMIDFSNAVSAPSSKSQRLTGPEDWPVPPVTAA